MLLRFIIKLKLIRLNFREVVVDQWNFCFSEIFFTLVRSSSSLESVIEYSRIQEPMLYNVATIYY